MLIGRNGWVGKKEGGLLSEYRDTKALVKRVMVKKEVEEVGEEL